MALSSGARSLLGELMSWGAAAAILVVGVVHYDTLRTALGDAIGIPANQSAAATDPAPAPARQAGPAGVEELRAASDGHYYARAEVNGRPLDVMVDTGASMVALTYEDAERAGIHLKPSDFTARVATANGHAAVAPVTLDRVSIGRITVRNVEAAVTERGRMDRTLLGMSFLSRIDRVGISQGRLVLAE
ncbi:MAG: TIGR02281 family clan AA aspartic protease [Hyphomicrobium sp.]|uniref:retropepsin-like aspartic protease family protein n=1 Tax=Hyphomicrobium sp. TaxID=82 RepID=UPI003D14F6DF